MCGIGKETLIHIIKKCVNVKKSEVEKEDVIDEKEKRIEWMKIIKRERKIKEDSE